MDASQLHRVYTRAFSFFATGVSVFRPHKTNGRCGRDRTPVLEFSSTEGDTSPHEFCRSSPHASNVLDNLPLPLTSRTRSITTSQQWTSGGRPDVVTSGICRRRRNYAASAIGISLRSRYPLLRRLSYEALWAALIFILTAAKGHFASYGRS